MCEMGRTGEYVGVEEVRRIEGEKGFLLWTLGLLLHVIVCFPIANLLSLLLCSNCQKLELNATSKADPPFQQEKCLHSLTLEP